MKLLSIETSGKMCGVCLSENEKIIDKLELNNGLTHSESLMPLVKELLEKNNLTIPDLDSFVCDIGPGSFTGIRIGVATIKAFVDTLPNAKYTGVTSLEALAYNSDKSGLICSIIDAKNNNCYYALYNLVNNHYEEIVLPCAVCYFEMLENIKQYSEKNITFVGDGAIFYRNEIKNIFANAFFLPDDLNNLDTSKLALAGFNRISLDNTLDLLPMYLKKPQAQRQFEEKNKKD